jgi:chromosome segregation ATPase
MVMIDMVREEIKKLEEQIKQAEDLLNRLKMAGEDVTQQMVKLTQLKQKLERYKKAFS